jgi:hypothetical protein
MVVIYFLQDHTVPVVFHCYVNFTFLCASSTTRRGWIIVDPIVINNDYDLQYNTLPPELLYCTLLHQGYPLELNNTFGALSYAPIFNISSTCTLNIVTCNGRFSQMHTREYNFSHKEQRLEHSTPIIYSKQSIPLIQYTHCTIEITQGF